MSMNFNEPVNDAALAMIKDALGEPAATDRKTFLFDKFNEIKQQEMKAIANAARQPATVEINGEGDVKTMADGAQYRVTPQGWQKIVLCEKSRNGQHDLNSGGVCCFCWDSPTPRATGSRND